MDTFELEGVQVGAFTAMAPPAGACSSWGGIILRGPTFRMMKRERGTACVEFEMPPPARGTAREGDSTGDARRVAFRLARIEYPAEHIGWWRIGREGDTDAETCRSMTLRLSHPPVLTTGRCTLPVPPRDDDEARGEPSPPPSSSSSPSSPRPRAFASSPPAASRRRQRRHQRQRHEPAITWGTPGTAADFTAGAAASSPVHMLAFRDAAQLSLAAGAIIVYRYTVFRALVFNA